MFGLITVSVHFQVHRMKAFSFIRSSLAGGCYQGSAPKPEDSASGFIPKVPSLLFDLEVIARRDVGIWPCRKITMAFDRLLHCKFWNMLQLEDGSTASAENQEDPGAPTVAAHIRSLTEPRSEEECQVNRHVFVFAVEALLHVCLFL